MASTSLDILLTPQSSSAKKNLATNLRSTYFTRRTNNTNYNSSGSFNSVLDRVSSAPQQSSAPRDSSHRSTVETTDKTSYNAAKSSQPKAQQSTPQDAPSDDFDQIKTDASKEPTETVKQPDEVEDAPSQSKMQMPIEMSALFSTSTESLLAVKDLPSNDEPVLMTVLPQQSNGNNQSMLNMLAGNTWRQLPTAIIDQQNPLEPAQLIPTLEEPIAQPLIDEDMLQATVLGSETQAQLIEPLVEGEQVELNQLPVDGDEPQLIQTRSSGNQANVQQVQTVEPTTVIDTEEPIAVPVQANEQPLQAPTTSNVPTENAQRSNAQPIVENADTAAQTQVISNDANLSNVIDAAKNSQPRAVTSDIQSTVEQPQLVETEAPSQPLGTISNATPVERQPSVQIDQPIAQPIVQSQQPIAVEAQQPVQTQQTIQTQQPTAVEQLPQDIPVEGINQPIEAQPDQAPRMTFTTVEPTTQTQIQSTVAPTEMPTTAEQTTLPIGEPQQTTQSANLDPTTQQVIAQPEELSAPTQTQQIFDDNNATPVPRGTENLNQPSSEEVEEPMQGENAQLLAIDDAGAEPVHRRFHGHANQQEALKQAQQSSSLRDRSTTFYQSTVQRRTAAQSANADGTQQTTLTQQSNASAENVLASEESTAVGAVSNPSAARPSLTSNVIPQGQQAGSQPSNAINENILVSEEPTAVSNLASAQPALTEEVSAQGQPTAVLSAASSRPAFTENVLVQDQRTGSQPLNSNVNNVLVNEQPTTGSQPSTPIVNNVLVNEQPTAALSSASPRPAFAENILVQDQPTAGSQPSTPIVNNVLVNEQPTEILSSSAPQPARTENVSVNEQPTAALNSASPQPTFNEEVLVQDQPRAALSSATPQPAFTEDISVQNQKTGSQPLNSNVNNVSVNEQPRTALSSSTPQPAFNENILVNEEPTAGSQPSTPIVNNVSVNEQPTAGSQPSTPTVNNVLVNEQPTAELRSASPQPAFTEEVSIQDQRTGSQPSIVNNVSLNEQPTAALSPSTPQPAFTEEVSMLDQRTGSQPSNTINENVMANVQPNAGTATAASQAQSTVVQNDSTVNRPVANMPQSFSVFGNELEINGAVTAPQQTASQFDQQQSNQQSQQQAQQQVQQQVQQQIQQQAFNAQVQAQQQAQQAPLAAAEGQPAMAQMPSETFAQNLGTAVNNLNMPQQTQNAQPSTPNTAFAQQLRDDFNVAGQIVEHARMFRNALTNSTEMVLQLKPEHLGELTLRVSVTAEGTVNASFHSENAAVRAIIENSLVSLKQELANQGLKVDNVEVYSGLADGGSLMNGRNRQAWQQNGRQNAQRVGRVKGARSSEGGTAQSTSTAQTVETAQPVENVSSDGGVDYKV